MSLQYSDIHTNWDYDISNLRVAGAWITPANIFVRNNNAWITIDDAAGNNPNLLVRNGGLWVSGALDRWKLTVCKTSSGTYLEEYTIPSTIFGLSVNKIIITQTSTTPVMYTKQYGGGTAFTHTFTKNGSDVYSLSGKHDDGYQCSSASWSNRGTFSGGIVYSPGDKIGVSVTIPNASGTDNGGTMVYVYARWYFN